MIGVFLGGLTVFWIFEGLTVFCFFGGLTVFCFLGFNCRYGGVFLNGGSPQCMDVWFILILENPFKRDDLGVPLF